MKSASAKRTLSRIYLTVVPFIAAIIGFAIGHVSYTVYLPIWGIHSCLMVLAVWSLGMRLIGSQDVRTKQLAVSAALLIAPWPFFSVFAGMGPPPTSAAGWVDTATEQQIRYAILVGGGVLLMFGFTLLKNQLNDAGEGLYSQLGFAALLIAMPLFVLNMTFWGSFLVESFRIFAASGSSRRPDWYLPVRDQFGWISAVEVSLMYLATGAFATSLRMVGWLTPTACRFYAGISSMGCLLSILPASSFEPLTIAGYLVSIPAIPFIMPYLMGVHLLQRIGEKGQ